MKSIQITLEGEEAIFSWKEGKIYCEGYDLESEKAVLALTGFGAGIGVLLVASNDCCKNEKEFMGEIQTFVAGHKKIVADQYKEWPPGQLLFEYYSYSNDPKIRWSGLESTNLAERHYKRMLKDPVEDSKRRMAMLNELPEQYFHQLVNLSDRWIKYNLARNKKCPIAVLEILAKNEDEDVREYVARNQKCPANILKILAKDKNDWVRWSVVSNPNCPQRLLGLLLKDVNIGLRQYAQGRLAKSEGLEV